MAVEAAGWGELLIYDPSYEEDHLEKRDCYPEYKSRVKHIYNMLEKVVINGSAKSKVRNFDHTKDGVLTYLYLRQYYYMYRGKLIYGHTQLKDLLQLGLHYNSLGGFDNYISNFEDMWQKLEEFGQDLSDDQQ